MELWEPVDKMVEYNQKLNSGNANEKRALFSRFYTLMIDRRLDKIKEEIKKLEESYLDDFTSYLNNTFNSRIKKLQEDNNLEYFEIKTIKNWLRKNEEELFMT